MANKSHGNKIKYRVYVRLYDRTWIYKVTDFDVWSTGCGYYVLELSNEKNIWVPIDKTIIEEI